MGRAGAVAMAHEGASVVVADIDLERAEVVAASCGGVAVAVDVCDTASVERMVDVHRRALRPARRRLPLRRRRAVRQHAGPAADRARRGRLDAHDRPLPDRRLPRRQVRRPPDAEAAVGLDHPLEHGRRARRLRRPRFLHGGQGRRHGAHALARGRPRARRHPRQRDRAELRLDRAAEGVARGRRLAHDDRAAAPARRSRRPRRSRRSSSSSRARSRGA